MSVKSKAAELRQSVRWRKKSISRQTLLTLASLGLNFLLGLMTGCVRIFGDTAPFGLAMTARSGGGPPGLMCLLGAAAGCALSGPPEWAIRYIAALVLVYTASFIFRDTGFSRRMWFTPALASLTMLGTGVLYYYDTLGKISTLAPLLTETVLTGLSAWLFGMGLSSEEGVEERDENYREAGVVLLMGCAVMALERVNVFGVLNPGQLLSAFAVMTAAYGGGAVGGSAAGVIFGAAVDLAAGETPFYALCYGFAGLMAGTMHKKGRLLFLLCFIAANAMAVFWQWRYEAHRQALYAVFASSVIFMLVSAKTMTRLISLVRRPDLSRGERGLRQYSAARARSMAGAFRELYEAVRKNAETHTGETDMATVYDRAAELVCGSCPQKSDCWQQRYVDMLSMLNRGEKIMHSQGCLELSDLPEDFRERCSAPGEFLAAVNGELRALVYRRRLRARLEENRSVAYGQFRYLAGVLDAVAEELKNISGPDAAAERRILRYLNARDIDGEVSVFRDHSGRLRAVIESARLDVLYREVGYMDRLSEMAGARMCRPASVNREEGRMVLLEAEPLAVSVGVAARKKDGETVSGDRGTYFKTEQGVLCVLLSDGMGSGTEAARESISVVRILERFLRAGVEPGTAMRILNSVMLLKNGENWGYATVDLMCIDLFTGETGFYKYGAAPSYIRTAAGVRRVKGVSMAAGVLSEDGEPPDVVRMRLRPGGVALIASDGVAIQQEDGWLRDMLSRFDGGDTREFARSVIREAGDRFGCEDDMTVLVIRVEERR